MIYSPYFRPYKNRAVLYFGGDSESSQDMDNSTHIRNDNYQSSASEGSTNLGGGSTNVDFFQGETEIDKARDVTIERVDDAIIAAAGNALYNSAVIASQGNRDALTFSAHTVDRSFDSIDRAGANAAVSQSAANQLVREANELFGTAVKEKTNDSATEVAKSTQRNLLIGAGILVVGWVAYKIFGNK